MSRHKTRNVRRKQWGRYRRYLLKIDGVTFQRGLHETYFLRAGKRVPAWWKI